MSLVSAICPECNSVIKVNSFKSAEICSCCGMPFVVKDAIDRAVQKDKFGNEFVRFGNLNWIILKRMGNGYSFIISEDAICRKKFNNNQCNTDWESCSLRKWLNNEFLIKYFSKDEREKIVSGNIPPDETPIFLKNKSVWSRDKIFLLSITEASVLFDSDEKRICKIRDCNCLWWLRSPVLYKDFAAYVNYDGRIITDGFFVTGKTVCVRPVMFVKDI